MKELQNKIILESLKAVLKTIKRNSTNNEFYIDTDLFEYNFLSDNAVKTIKKILENY